MIPSSRRIEVKLNWSWIWPALLAETEKSSANKHDVALRKLTVVVGKLSISQRKVDTKTTHGSLFP